MLDVLEQAQLTTILKDGWKLDSGATQHICNTLSLYTSTFMSYGTPRILQVGKAAVYLRAMGEGTVSLQVPSGPPSSGGSGITTFILTKVWFCSDCPFNLISTRRVVATGCKVVLSSSDAQIFDPLGNVLVWMGMEACGLYACLHEDASSGAAGAAGFAGAVDLPQEVGGVNLPPGMGMFWSQFFPYLFSNQDFVLL